MTDSNDDTRRNGARPLTLLDILREVGFSDDEAAFLAQSQADNTQDKGTLLLACVLRLSLRVNRMEEYLRAKAEKAMQRGGLWVPPEAEN